MTVYSDYQVYGPYTRKDGRKHVVLIKHNNGSIVERKTVSYPKYLVEIQLNRYLTTDETVDHIDGNFENNDLPNLRVVPRSLHALSHTSSREVVTKKCFICGTFFVSNNSNRVTCGSKSCAGACAHILGHNKGYNRIYEFNILTSNRSLLEEISTVEDANSGNLLVGNPEQGN